MAIPTRVNNTCFFIIVALYLLAIRMMGIVDSEFGARGDPLGVSIYIAAPLSTVKKNLFVLISLLFMSAVSGMILQKLKVHVNFLSISAAFVAFCILAFVASTMKSDLTANRLVLDWVKVATIARNASSERVLVVQTAGFTKYRALLDATRPTNEAYALRNGYDYLSASGIFFGTKESHSTFNKAFLLELALERHEYDVLLSLDADAMVVDPLFAPAALLPHHGPNVTLLAASRGASNEPHTWDVNAGVLVWNLRHPRAQDVSEAWAAECRKAVMQGENDDQALLHKVLRALGPEARSRSRKILGLF